MQHWFNFLQRFLPTHQPRYEARALMEHAAQGRGQSAHDVEALRTNALAMLRVLR